jgi:dipeptidyl aminopeptidase/acylaminoacyl peptidase
VSRWREPAPGEHEAGERSWEVVRGAYAERLPDPHKRDWRMVAAIAIAVALFAAAVTPPGMAVLGSLRDVARGEKNAHLALAALPSGGRLLTESAAGVWVVQRDGSKRLLRGYRDASWSPHGKFLAAVHGNELRALEPNGAVHWSLGRTGRIESPHWSYDGFRIAYFAAGALRIVNGDGTGDRALTRAARPGRSAWQPRTHALAYVNRAGDIQVANVDKLNRSATIQTRAAPLELEWTSDGRWLVAAETRELEVFAPRGPRIGGLQTSARMRAIAVSPDSKRVAFVETKGPRSSLWLTGVLGGPTERVFSGAGEFLDVDWSPDARWLLLNWTSADQWLFIRTPVKKLVAVSNIRADFGDRTALRGWCCP